MIKKENPKKFIANQKASVKEVLKVIDRNKQGMALVVDDQYKLLGTITDGDIRRHILRNGDINLSCENVMNESYVSLSIDSVEEAKRLMSLHKLRHIPLLKEGKILNKVFVTEQAEILTQPITAVIMAGGEGKRLRSLSESTPKPLVKIKEKTMLEEMITNLRDHGIEQIYLSLNYKAQVIKDYFKGGSKLGVDLYYLVEKKKLGTAGALSLLPKDEVAETVLVVNADVLTAVNFKSFIKYYEDHKLDMCVAAKEYVFDIPFGVFDMDGGSLKGIKEKPSQGVFCNAGIYVMNKRMLAHVPSDKSYEMTDFIKLLIEKSKRVEVFPLYEYWIDVGNTRDFKKAEMEYDTLFNRRSYE